MCSKSFLILHELLLFYSQSHFPTVTLKNVSENPNRPLLVFKPEVPIVCLEYNQKDPNSLVSGQLNGQVAVWDARRGSEPVELSVMEVTHRDPVRKVLWIHSKSGTEFFRYNQVECSFFEVNQR